MSIKDFHLLRSLWLAVKLFFKEDGMDKCSILAYYSIFSSLFLLTFFTFLFTKFLGDPNLALRSVYPFSPDFFTSISPEIMNKAGEISSKMKEIGVIGILLSFILGFLVIIKIVQFVNSMFHINLKDKKSEKGFWIRRLSEFSLLFVIGFLVVASFFFSSMISTLTLFFRDSEIFSNHINPEFFQAVNTFLVKYLLPFVITFLFFFILYKWIPEKVVYIRGAVISAIICTILWELSKRAYTYYLLNISFFGKIKGPIIAIILFGFWMELSMAIMLYGAKLTYIIDKGHANGQTKTSRKRGKSSTPEEPHPTRDLQ